MDFLSFPDCVFLPRGKVSYLRCQLEEALVVYTEAAKLAKDQREIEHIVLYEKGERVYCSASSVHTTTLSML